MVGSSPKTLGGAFREPFRQTRGLSADKSNPMKTASMLLLITALAFAGCATRPQSITAAYVPEATYADISRDDAVKEQARIIDELGKATKQQEATADGDFYGVLLIGIPAGGDDLAIKIASLKGYLQQLQKVAVAKWPDFHCEVDPSTLDREDFSKKKRR